MVEKGSQFVDCKLCVVKTSLECVQTEPFCASVVNDTTNPAYFVRATHVDSHYERGLWGREHFPDGTMI